MASKVFSGVVWASVQRFGTLAISFISNMVLARLLTPDDFGTIGMLMFFIAIAQTFIDSGFGSALIQKKEITQEDKSTVFVINMVMSVVLYILLFVSAPAISRFYEVPLLCSLLRVLGLELVIKAFGLIQSTQLIKQLDFKKLSICNLTGAVVIAIVGITAALLGCGVWSLVICTLCGTLVTNILLWSMCRWKPSLLFSVKSFRQLFSFGGFMLLSSIIFTITNNVQSLIVGKLFNQKTLGNYTQARTLRNVASDGITSVISQVLYPDFSRYQNDNAEIKRRLENSAEIITYVVAPIMFFCIITGSELIHTIYGGQWDEAIPYFRLMCIGGIPICLQDININVIKAKGHSRMLFYCNLVKVVLYFGFMLLGAKIAGIIGFIVSMIIYTSIAYLFFAFIGTHYIETTMHKQLVSVVKSICLSIPSIIICYIIGRLLCTNEIMLLLIQAILYFGIYWVVSYILKPYAFIFLKQQVIDRIKSKIKCR